jgi:hypothetical protein
VGERKENQSADTIENFTRNENGDEETGESEVM